MRRARGRKGHSRESVERNIRRAAMTGVLQLLREMPVKAIVLAAAAAAAGQKTV